MLLRVVQFLNQKSIRHGHSIALFLVFKRKLTKILQKTPVERLEKAFKIAEQKFGVPQLLDAELVASSPDALSIMTYLTFFKKRVCQRVHGNHIAVLE